jgi:glycyl-tRNA synthetase
MKEIKEILLKNKPLFEDLVKRKFVYGHSAEIYGGFAGLFDLGPIGCAL